MKKGYLDQCLESAMPKGWSKYTTMDQVNLIVYDKYPCRAQFSTVYSA